MKGEYGGAAGLDGGVGVDSLGGSFSSVEQSVMWLLSWLSGIEHPQLWHTSLGQKP